MSHLFVTAHIKSKLEFVEKTKEELQKLIPPTLKEEGCIKYDLHQSISDETEFLFYEIWTSKEALDAHSKSPHITKFREVREEFLDGSPRVELWEGA